MKTKRACLALFTMPALAVGLALSAAPPASANDTGAFIGGVVAGALLNELFDRDYPRGITYPGRPVWFRYPATGVYEFPTWSRPYPYGHRWWVRVGKYQGRGVFMPALSRTYGPREVVAIRLGPGGPVFVAERHYWYSGPRHPAWGSRGTRYPMSGWQPSRPPDWYRLDLERRHRDRDEGWRWDRDRNRDRDWDGPRGRGNDRDDD